MSDLKAIKCTKIDFGWGSAPDLAGGAYSASPDSLAGFKGLTSKEREERGKEGEGRKRRGGRKGPPPCIGMGSPNESYLLDR